MAKLTDIEFTSIPNMRVIGREVSVSMGDEVENPVPALWEQSTHDGTIALLKALPLVIENCTIGWMGNAIENEFTYIVGVAATENTPVPAGMAHRDLPACDVARGTVHGRLENGDVFGRAHIVTVDGIEAQGYQPDYSFGWSAELYPDEWDYEGTEGSIMYLCPYSR
ncbi:MAG: GyrI-like domain-containing protein [Thermomicrobiales bacterium]|nr:GyrI-like domain-containing protein [Thermomicrobiales bacterium]MCO5224020.1 GyrI-like domain-containing protein [Thermomicrobiales bacterium]MCO5226834.1 GyrI-like domain-containing protein [Thermomicrobiales bacterium]